MFWKRNAFFGVALLLLFFGSELTLACACCAEPGTYTIRTEKIDPYYRGLLADLVFDKAADLYITEAGFDLVKGLDSVRSEYESDSWVAGPGRFDLVALITYPSVRFELKTPARKPGGLLLPLPAQMLSFKADIHDGSDSGLGPLLYKEFRFKGSVQSGTGFIRAGLSRPASYSLVLQGRGNNCDNASDFKNWRLEIAGPRASFAFYGKLASRESIGNGTK